MSRQLEKVMLKRETGRNPLFDVWFSFISENEKTFSPPGTSSVSNELRSEEAKFDLVLMGIDNGVGEGLSFTMQYRTNLFKKQTIELFIDYFKDVLSSVLENNSIALKDIYISHDLGTAKANAVLEDEEGFGFQAM